MEQGMWCETCVRARGAVLSLVVALLAACGPAAALPATGRFADGRVAVFILGNNGVLHMRRQDTPSSGVWAAWEMVGDAVSRF